MKSPKTTILGVLAITGAAVAFATALLDGKAETVPDILATLSAISAGIGLITAKDANVTGGTIPSTPEAAARLQQSP
jgi:2-methylisocitrate lyase-like PEP mutase family enzyme